MLLLVRERAECCVVVSCLGHLGMTPNYIVASLNLLVVLSMISMITCVGCGP